MISLKGGAVAVLSTGTGVGNSMISAKGRSVDPDGVDNTDGLEEEEPVELPGVAVGVGGNVGQYVGIAVMF